MNETQLAWTIFILFHIVISLLEYGIGRVIYRVYEGTWERETDHLFYWLVGCITVNVLGWSTVGIIRLIQWI